MTCRDEVLVAARELANRSGTGEFTLDEVLTFMANQGTHYKESTIRTHVTSRMQILQTTMLSFIPILSGLIAALIG